MGSPTNFDTTRLRLGDLVAGISGAVLILSLFLEWYNVSAKNFSSVSAGVTGWEAMGFFDILLFLIGAVAVAIAVLRAMNTLPARLPASPGFILLVLGVIAAVIVLIRIISIPDRGVGDLPGVDVGRSFGVFLAFLAAAGVTVGGWLDWNEEGKPKPGTLASGPAGGPLGQGQPAGGQPEQPYGQAPGQQQYGAQPQQQAYGGQPSASAAPQAQPQAAQPGAQPEGAHPADWYPDPRGEKRLRYWDGSKWTDHTAD